MYLKPVQLLKKSEAPGTAFKRLLIILHLQNGILKVLAC